MDETDMLAMAEKLARVQRMRTAILEGDSRVVEEMVQQGYDLNASQPQGVRPIHIAAERQNKELIIKLVGLGARINVRDDLGRTPLHYAAMKDNDEEFFTTLIRLGGDIEARGICDFTPIWCAVIFSKLKSLEVLLKLGADCNGRVNLFGILQTFKRYRTLPPKGKFFEFALAFRRGQVVDVIHLGESGRIHTLRHQGFDMNEQFFRDITPLALAVLLGDLAAVECLGKHGADPNVPFDLNVTPIHVAVSSGNSEMVKMLASERADVNARKIESLTPLCLAIEDSNISMIRCLVNLGANLDWGYSDGVVPLHGAVNTGNMEMVRCLASLGADLNAVQGTHLHPANLAVIKGNTKMMKCLHSLGAKIETEGTTKVAAIHIASEKNSVDMINCLAELGADLNAGMFVGASPLIDAVGRGDTRMVKCLAECGVDMNSHYNDRVTALHDAVLRENYGAVINLIKRGAMIHCRREHKTSCINQAIVRGNVTMVACLASLRCDMNWKHDEGVTPFHDAVRLKNKKMMRLLDAVGSDLDVAKDENVRPVYQAVVRDDLQMVKCLQANGADLKARCNENVPVIFDALQTKDEEFVEFLIRLGANPNLAKTEHSTAVASALRGHSKSMVEYLTKEGAGLNCTYNDKVTPLLDSVRSGNVAMIQTLVQNGAEINIGMTENMTQVCTALFHEDIPVIQEFVKLNVCLEAKLTDAITPLHMAIQMRNLGLVKQLIDLGARVNAPSVSYPVVDVGVAHGILLETLIGQGMKVSPLEVKNPFDVASTSGAPDIMTDLESNGAVYNQTELYSTLDKAIEFRNSEAFSLLVKTMGNTDLEQKMKAKALLTCSEKWFPSGIRVLLEAGADFSAPYGQNTALHNCCRHGDIDGTRFLMISGADIQDCNGTERAPCQLRPFSSKINYHYVLGSNNRSNRLEIANPDLIDITRCLPLDRIHAVPGLGNANDIDGLNTEDIYQEIEELFKNMKDSSLEIYQRMDFRRIGSSAEGTRTGFPNEMDFLFYTSKAKVKFTGNYKETGYMIYKHDENPTFHEGSKSFHARFHQELFNKAIPVMHRKGPVTSHGRISIPFHDTTGPAARTFYGERKACTPLFVRWDNGEDRLCVSIDAVPFVSVDGWPEGAIESTWLLNNEELRKRGYGLVPKPPHEKSELGKKYATTRELQYAWRISFPHLEVEHMQSLDQSIRDVYVTAKCIRNPDVCHIMVRDGRGMPRGVDDYITSYMLKMTFLHNVQNGNFRSSGIPLGTKVCKLFLDLEEFLAKGHVPLFFIPSVNALAGLKMDLEKCQNVSRLLRRFVCLLYARDHDCDIFCEEPWIDDSSDMSEKRRKFGSKERDAQLKHGHTVDALVYSRTARPMYNIYDIGNLPW